MVRRAVLKRPCSRLETARLRRAMVSTVDAPFGLTPLEAAAVLPSTAAAYHAAVRRSAGGCGLTGKSWSTVEVLDQLLVEFLNHLYLDGANVGEATQTIAGLKHFLPSTGTKTVKRGLPRVQRALRD